MKLVLPRSVPTMFFYRLSLLSVILRYISPLGARTKALGSKTSGIGVFSDTPTSKLDSRLISPTFVCSSPNLIPAREVTSLPVSSTAHCPAIVCKWAFYTAEQLYLQTLLSAHYALFNPHERALFNPHERGLI